LEVAGKSLPRITAVCRCEDDSCGFVDWGGAWGGHFVRCGRQGLLALMIPHFTHAHCRRGGFVHGEHRLPLLPPLNMRITFCRFKSKLIQHSAHGDTKYGLGLIRVYKTSKINVIHTRLGSSLVPACAYSITVLHHYSLDGAT